MKKRIISLFIVITLLTLALASCMASPATSVGISKIEKTSTNGLVDTYTIYYDDGRTSTFTVTNGKDGKDGEDGFDGLQGAPGKDGVDGKDGLNGKDGKDGENGVDGENFSVEALYETYKTLYGDIEYSEFLELFLDLSGGVDDAKAINELLLSTGKIYAETSDTHVYYPINTHASGSCVIYSMNESYAYLVTNYHVVYDERAESVSDKIYAYLYGSESAPLLYHSDEDGYFYEYDEYAIECEYVGGSLTSDIAVLKVSTADILNINPLAKAVTLADGYSVGERAITVGNAEDNGISVTSGIVCVESEEISSTLAGTTLDFRVMRIDTAMYHGNSGGGVFNSEGKLIGIANAGDEQSQNVNYAIPISLVKSIAGSIIASYEDGNISTFGAYRIKLGVTVTIEKVRYEYDAVSSKGRIVETLRADAVEDGSIADAMGIRSDDVLLAVVIDGVRYEIYRSFDIFDALITVRAGSVIKIEYERSAEVRETDAYTVSEVELISVK